MAAVLVVRAVVDEDAQRYADLVGGEADPPGGVHGGEEIFDEAFQCGAEVGDLLAGGGEDRVAEQGQGPDTSGAARNGTLSHGDQRTQDGVAGERAGAAVRGRARQSIG